MELLNLIKMQKFYNITSIICLIICIFEAILFPLFNKDKVENEDESKDVPIIQPNGHVSLLKLIILLVCDLIIIIYSIWHLKIDFNHLYIPILILAFCLIIIKPFISVKVESLDYTTYSIFCYWFCYILQNIKYESIINCFSNTLLVESFIIVVLLIKIYIFLFSIILNIRYLLKLIKCIFKVNKLDYTLSEKLMINYNILFKYRNLKGIKKVLLFFIYIYESIINIVKMILYLINEVSIIPMLFIIRNILRFVNIIINYDDGKFNFLACKMLLVITFIVVYTIISINKLFMPELINIYEYISTAIIIPILLDGIISYKDYIKKVK
ncbi:hypothetical protein EGP91_00495 [bacterium]|nr:hypothetical protein [bacterium]